MKLPGKRITSIKLYDGGPGYQYMDQGLYNYMSEIFHVDVFYRVWESVEDFNVMTIRPFRTIVSEEILK